MDIATKDQISRLIEAMTNMATAEFAESQDNNSTFETSFPLEDENADYARLVCEGLQFGLRETFKSSVVSATIEDSYYKVRISR
jgi:hypothetical protein